MIREERTCNTPLWIIESGLSKGEAGPAHALASRFDLSFRRLRDLASMEPGCVPPRLVMTSGSSAAFAGLSLRRRFGVPVVHCTHHGTTGFFGQRLFDELILSATHPVRTHGTHVIPVLGPLSIVSPTLYERARHVWGERLEHLPSPRVAAVLDAGGAIDPRRASVLGRQLGEMVRAENGSVMVSVARGVAREVAESFIAGLDECFSLVWRHGEPDDDPTLGFMACADAIVLYGCRVETVIEAAASDLPLFVEVVPGRFGTWNRLVRTLMEQGMLRLFDRDISPWVRSPLDEAGRVAQMLRRRFGL
ncbi:ELM1/GtrOC1 family putative glycosyltransferase [Acetobacter estunensis]|uniref:ELM1/GtrOC1 family putative glycosyltransferase n=1 Tax=Acetobacter estunensis TaxID=104097 RepID=UPI001C2CD762|nr:ELM1/GtrOC1 family putative glycosyltransferase [Acetobacter estunensis]MBV1838202.1 mitochondrial fission ELM1 family protein [Acetobacter estunensis]